MNVTPLVKDFQPLDTLESRLVESWREVTQATHAFLTLLREFDLRQGWRECGNNDCRVAQLALRHLPLHGSGEGAGGPGTMVPAADRRGVPAGRSVVLQGAGADPGGNGGQ